MRYGNYTFQCRLESRAILPPYKGSTFRGVFGHALKKVVCAMAPLECAGCLLKTGCVYALVFETAIAKPPPEGARMAAPPHPFVIRPPADPRTGFAPGDAFEFNLILFGEMNRYLPYFIYAFDTMGEMGIGRKINGRRGRFTLQAVMHNSQTIYTARDERIHIGDTLPRLSVTQPPGSPGNGEIKMAVEFLTPLRLKFKNRFAAELPFHVLVRAMLRRADALLRVYGTEAPALDFPGLVRRAETVRTTATTLRWTDWHRYSHRQGQKMLMGGLTGRVTYEGAIAEFLPLMDFCEKTHIGKQTAFGLGRMKVRGNGG